MGSLRLKVLLLTVAGCMGHAFATGFYGPSEYLEHGGSKVVATPEFYWELETKRLARDFHPTEKPRVVARGFDKEGLVDQAPMLKATSDADIQDFADALKTGEIKPPDPAQATQQHANARDVIAAPNGTALPPEFDSEFADYHRGAYAYRLGKDHWADARTAWEGLLMRPAAQRHYRTVWASFMLGKLAMKRGDADAAKWFQQTRDVAKQGFADSLGMAADSYGWQGRTEWKLGHPDKAAPLFLTQLALGDESAIVSLKALIPDRTPIDGMLNFGPESDQVQKPVDGAVDAQTLEALEDAAADPLLRKLVTAHILATGSAGSRWSSDSLTTANLRSARWLKVLTDAKLGAVEDAEYLGWVGYLSGEYQTAQRWLDLAKGDSPAADWLRAKLQLRAGHLEDAIKSLAKAFVTLRNPALYTGWMAGPFQEENANGPTYVYRADDEGWSMSDSATGDLGQLHLARGDFIQAMDILLKGGLWEDAAFVAERILTTDELKVYVDKLPLPPPSLSPSRSDHSAKANDPQEKASDTVRPADVAKLRYLLGRRLVREHRFVEAVSYLPAPYDKILKRYTQALKDGGDEKRTKLDRARAFFTAAWLARHDGMELMGTEVAPDGFVFGGEFESTDLAQEILAGKYTEKKFDGAQETSVTLKIPDLVSHRELQRLKENKIKPDARWHYRYIAAALAMQAAGLMNDNTEELADVVNTAGLWVKDLNEQTGDRYYQVMERRCAKTSLGAAASAKHWFVDQQGAWSTEQQAAYNAMHKEYGDPKQNTE